VPLDPRVVAWSEVVEDPDVVPVVEERLVEVAADNSGPSPHEYLYTIFSKGKSNLLGLSKE
jgi:hypothetical protein